MATPSAGIAEAYMTKRTYQEKIKKMEKIEAGGKEADKRSITAAHHESKGGFFSGMFKKVHSSADVPSSETAVQSWDNKN